MLDEVVENYWKMLRGLGQCDYLAHWFLYNLGSTITERLGDRGFFLMVFFLNRWLSSL